MKQDVKTDTLKAQLDDALRQSVDGTLLVNPEMVTKQVEAIMNEQILLFKKWYDKSNWVPINIKNGVNKNMYTDRKVLNNELLQIFKEETGLI